MLGRPFAIWFLAFVALIAGLITLVVTLQFLEILPWAGDEATFWGGKWAGVALYGVETILFFAIAIGWLTLKPWAPLLTLIFALFGFFVPFMSYLAGTDLFSSALVPMIFSAIIVFLSFRPSVRYALAHAAAAKTAPNAVATGAATAPARSVKPAPPAVRPKGFRADDV